MPSSSELREAGGREQALTSNYNRKWLFVEFLQKSRTKYNIKLKMLYLQSQLYSDHLKL